MQLRARSTGSNDNTLASYMIVGHDRCDKMLQVGLRTRLPVKLFRNAYSTAKQ